MEKRDETGGIVALVTAMTCFVVSDVFTKLATSSMPVGQTLTLRGVISVAIFAVPVLLYASWRQVPTHASKSWALRIAAEAGTALTFVTALTHMPIANLTAILQTSPLALTAFGAIVLGERVGLHRWVATVVGFAGMLLIVRPGASGYSAWAVMGVLAMLFVVIRDVATRYMDKSIPATLVTMTSAAGVCLSGLVLGAFERPWVTPTGRDWAVLTGGAAMVACAYYFSIQAVRKADLSTIAPFRYVILPLSIFAGFVVWREVPDPISLVGIALIAGAGLYAFMRARSAGRAPTIEKTS